MRKAGRPSYVQRSSWIVFTVLCLSACQKYDIKFQSQIGLVDRKLQKLPDVEPAGYAHDTALHFVMTGADATNLTFNEHLWLEIFPCGNNSLETRYDSAVYLGDELVFADDLGFVPNERDVFAVYSLTEISSVAALESPPAATLCARMVYREPYYLKGVSNTVEFPVRQ